MTGRTFRHFTTFVTTCTVAMLLASALFVAGGSSSAQAASLVSPFKSHKIIVDPTYKRLSDNEKSQVNGKVLFNCQKSTAKVHCYGPDQIRAAYGVQKLLDKGITGKGTSITIIDAYGSPNLLQDLATFNKLWGLPDAKLNVYTPYGVDGIASGWAAETTLDVEWAHVMAPDATINLIVARTNNDTDILDATKYMVDNNIGDVLSQSYGEAEECVDPALLNEQHKVFRQATKRGISLFASSGDAGSAQPSCDGTALIKAASSPANDPLVTSVGGTQLIADLTTGKYISETAWNESPAGGSTGGGFSKTYKRPAYQKGIIDKGDGRGIPNVALNASVDYGVLVAFTDPDTGDSGFYLFGGTSVGSPEFAGITALGVQLAGHRLGFLNDSIYRIGKSPLYKKAFHDITTGDNVLAGTGIPGYSADDGWDPVTGWGTPKVPTFLPALIAFKYAGDGRYL